MNEFLIWFLSSLISRRFKGWGSTTGVVQYYLSCIIAHRHPTGRSFEQAMSRCLNLPSDKE